MKCIKNLFIWSAVLVAFASAYPASAFYNPGTGQWLSRDPIEERGGENMYTHVGNAPVSRVDSLGLEWKVTRDGQDTAPATCGCMDTIEDLAKKIGLAAQDFKAWLQSDDGKPLPDAASKPVGEQREFKIPNYVMAYWGGERGKFGKGWVHWNESVAFLKQRGFSVDSMDHPKGKSDVLENLMTGLANDKVLHGFYFWGHGNQSGLAGYNQPDMDPVVTYASISLPYKVALGLSFACESDAGKPFLFSNAPGGIWHGYPVGKVLLPLFDFWHVANWIHPGDQQTKPKK
jgi:hypothetical protein